MICFHNTLRCDLIVCEGNHHYRCLFATLYIFIQKTFDCVLNNSHNSLYDLNLFTIISFDFPTKVACFTRFYVVRPELIINKVGS